MTEPIHYKGEAETDILNYLPHWFTAAAIPAGAVMVFFRKGDEALSEDLKKWLSQKILGRQINSAGYRKYFALAHEIARETSACMIESGLILRDAWPLQGQAPQDEG